MKTLLIAVTIFTAMAQSSRETFHAESRLVQMSVSVTGSDNAKLDGLAAEDFLVRDNGNPRSVTSVSQGDRLPLKMILLVETSASQKSEVNRLVDTFSDAIELLGPDDQLGLARVLPGYEVLLKPTTERAVFSSALQQLKTKLDDRAQFDFEDLTKALLDISKTETDSVTQLVVVLASNDFDLLNPETSAAAARRLASNRTIVATFLDLQNTGVAIAKNNVRAMRAVTPMRFFVRDRAASYYAIQTGGAIVNVRDSDYRTAMENLLATFAHAYLIGFVPPEEDADGEYHKLRVTIKPQATTAKVRVVHRDGYWADREPFIPGLDRSSQTTNTARIPVR